MGHFSRFGAHLPPGPGGTLVDLTPKYLTLVFSRKFPRVLCDRQELDASPWLFVLSWLRHRSVHVPDALFLLLVFSQSVVLSNTF